MKLATFRAPGAAHETLAGEVRSEGVIAFDDGSTVLDRLATGDRTPAGGTGFALADVELLAPVPRPRAVFGIGLNYGEHAAESGREPPERPIVFMKLPSSVTAPGGPVRVPPAAAGRLDYEGELAVVMGTGGTVAGFAVADDLSARDLQRAEPQWTRAKGFDSSCPLGPWVTTADELGGVGGAASLRLRTWVGGELRQDARTSDLIFDVPAIVAFLSETITLEPGDVILTGTPSGVGAYLDPPRFLAPGDSIRIEIERLGTIEHLVA